MGYEYSDESRIDEPTSLPDVEVFYDGPDPGRDGKPRNFDSEGNPVEAGWYFAFGFPGCLWDGEPEGPFPTREAALAAARELTND